MNSCRRYWIAVRKACFRKPTHRISRMGSTYTSWWWCPLYSNIWYIPQYVWISGMRIILGQFLVPTSAYVDTSLQCSRGGSISVIWYCHLDIGLAWRGSQTTIKTLTQWFPCKSSRWSCRPVLTWTWSATFRNSSVIWEPQNSYSKQLLGYDTGTMDVNVWHLFCSH